MGLADDMKNITEGITDSYASRIRATRDRIKEVGELAGNTQNLSKVACRFDCPEAVAVPDRTAATHLFRIAQEATQNAMRHARASNIILSLQADENVISLTVCDDGCGLPEHKPHKGLGLEIMHYRARVIGATLIVRRGQESGTAMCCTMPRDAFNLESAP